MGHKRQQPLGRLFVGGDPLRPSREGQSDRLPLGRPLMIYYPSDVVN